MSVFGTVTILGVLITVIAFINGRATRKVILQLGESIGKLIKEEIKSTRELIVAETRNTRELIKELKSK